MILKRVVILAALVAGVVATGESLAEGKDLQEAEGHPDLIPALVKASVGLFQGRNKKGGGQGLMLVGATMLAMGMAALAALAGKAAAASMAALLLAAASLLKKSNSDGGHASAYEVISHHGRRYLQAADGYNSYQADN